MNDGAAFKTAGHDALSARPLVESIWRRRTHRVSRGVPMLKTDSMTYTSNQKPLPVNELEEAVLIAMSGRAHRFGDAGSAVSGPNVRRVYHCEAEPDDGRSHSRQPGHRGTSFFMINDSGTYFIKKLPSLDAQTALTPQALIDRAHLAKVKVLDRRIDTGDRDFLAYLGSNRFLSNLPGTTTFFPVVDLSHQYINGLMYLLTQPKGHRPALVDDRNFYRKTIVDKWGSQGFSKFGHQDTAARDHADIEYYDKYFRNWLTDAHR